MIDAIIGGKLQGKPEQRTGRSGQAFVTAKVRAATGEDSVFVNCVAFSESAKVALLALDDGDAVSLAGPLTPKAWVDREGNARPALDMVVNVVMTAYTVKRKREAVAPKAAAQARVPSPDGGYRSHAPEEFDSGEDGWLAGQQQ